MNTLHTIKDAPAVNDYFTGEFKWPYAVVLEGAILNTLAGSMAAGISLEIGGILTGLGFTVPAYPGPLSMQSPILEIKLGVAVPANTPVRWRVTASADDPDDRITLSSITISATAQGTAVPPAMTVRWVNGQEVTTLYTYDPVTHLFADVSNGLAASRVSLTQNPFQASFLIPGTAQVMRVDSGKLVTDYLTLTGGSSPGSHSPALEFLVGAVIVATLLADGTLIAPSAQQGTVADDPTRFIFLNGASLVASFGTRGVTAVEFDEPL